MAGINDEIVNPETKYATAQNKIALRIIPNSPSVIMLIGIVRIERIGLINKLISPSTSPAISATCHDATIIPGTKYAASTTAADNMSHLMMSFNININVRFPLSLIRKRVRLIK
jgi:hypothetical protein